MPKITFFNWRSNYWLYIIVTAALAVRLAGLRFPFGDYDEGVYLATVRAVLRGFPLISQTYISQGPLFIYLAEPFYKLAPLMASVRLLPVISSLVVIILSYRLIRQYIGVQGAIFAGLYLAFDTYFLSVSRTFQADMPWLAMSLGGFYYLIKFHERKSTTYLLLSAVLAGLALFVKLNPILLVVILGYFLLMIGRRGWGYLGFYLIYLAVLVVSWLALIHPSDYAAFYHSSIAIRSGHISTISSSWLIGDRLALLKHEAFLLSIGLGVACGLGRRAYFMRREISFWLEKNMVIVLSTLWFLITLISFNYYHLLFRHHLVFLILPGVIIASFGMQNIYHQTKNKFGQVGLFLILALVIIYAAVQDKPINRVIFPKTDNYQVNIMQIADYIKNNSGLNDFVASDDQLVLYLADRNAPPPLVDTSFANIEAGLLTDRGAIEATQLYKPEIVVAVSGRFANLKQYIQYLEQNYHKTKLEGATIYSK